MNVVVINPPLVQLNTPYPSGAYLSSFFKNQHCPVKWYDFSLELYYSIFSRSGLTKLFDLTKTKALKMADSAERQNDISTAFNLRRYVQTSQNWVNWIDDINSILCGKAREKEHQFLFSPFAPRGNRMDTFLSSLDHTPTVDDVRFLCSYALADLADYITAVFDPNFSLIRYAESVVAENRSFQTIESELNSPVLNEFYKQVLEKILGGESLPLAPTAAGVFRYPLSGETPATPPDDSLLVCISIPFAGTFVPALYTARWIKQNFPNVKISIGGGYVNTEMRNWTDPSLGKYADYISYDRGYGSYLKLLNKTQAEYKLLQFTKNQKGEIQIIQPQWQNAEIEKIENEITCNTYPDYTDIDFSRYPRVCDDTNPMHRMWSDGAWIKAYLAHGCYWHNCAFCDTKLDYVCGYKIVNVEKLYENLLETAKQKGVYGIHFVDEALPPVALIRFAICNAQHGNPLYFWGNVRFEKAFTKDLAAFLSCCGFGGVSAGIEVATGTGLKNINKGTDMQSIVSACAAFKEAGILVHAYMIYGFWYDTPQTIIDSMETLRQFYKIGLLDSSFWHKFLLTKYSPAQEIKECKNKNLNEYNKYGPPLENALNAWMHGQKLETKVQKWFDFSVPSPTIPQNYVEKLIQNYEDSSSVKIDYSNIQGLYWLASAPVIIKSGNKTTLVWLYLQEEYQSKIEESSNFNAICSIINSLAPTATSAARESALEQIKKSPELQHELQRFHNKGLVIL